MKAFHKVVVVAGAGVILALAFSVQSVFTARAEWLELAKSSRKIGTIDFYGLRAVTETQVRAQLRLRVGGPGPINLVGPTTVFIKAGEWLAGVQTKSTVETRLRQIPGVVRAQASLILDLNGKAALFIGIEEKDAQHFEYRPAPSASIVLPGDIADVYGQHQRAFLDAIKRQDPPLKEDDSQGHAIFSDVRMHALEGRMILFAATDLQVVRDVLKNAVDASQRAAAAMIIAYAHDKRAILPDLLAALSDPNEEVRNNATRAIALIAAFANERPELGIHINPAPFTGMLNSLMWTDRNKAIAVLGAMTRSVPHVLKGSNLTPLIEMARWKDSHGLDALQVLGHVSGMTDQEIQQAWDLGQRERVIALALTSAPNE